ncbi:integrase family protein [Bradyrhizobium barranii subsp. apii]|uniref:tyrosine-type recombinase/integrase n=1 Tax=Bradyrhizobium barranii TaxID=2992140 RepID=UPI001AA1A7CC|nr:integrase family protein [Bradyrhizobium barranii]UPT98876.1 integrase family protein [Bradyrhizobium barranii subsp. apii]
MKIKFTDTFIRALKATGKAYSHGDTEHRGLMIRVGATGGKTFAMAYHAKANQKTRFLTFGRYPDVTLADAFRRHADARAAIENGDDPQAAKATDRAQKKSSLTVDQLIEAFVAKSLSRKRTARDSTRRLHRISHAFGWGDRDAASITDDEAQDCLTRLADREYRNERDRVIGGKVEAFACKSLLGTMWKWAKRSKLLRTNIFRDLDVDGARKPRRRNRVLTPDEIRTLWAETENPQAFGFTADCATALRLILATAARPGMVTGIQRDELVDLDAPEPRPVLWGQLREVTDDDASNGPIWQLSHERMKRSDDEDEATDPFMVPLNGIAVGLIAGAQGRDNRRVLGAALIGANATTRTMRVNQPAALMRAIWQKHGFPAARPHDLRRTAATLIQSAVLPDRPMKWSVEEVGWLLGHRNEKGGPVTLVYARYDHFDEKRAMAATLERELIRILAAGKAARVQPAA